MRYYFSIDALTDKARYNVILPARLSYISNEIPMPRGS